MNARAYGRPLAHFGAMTALFSEQSQCACMEAGGHFVMVLYGQRTFRHSGI